MKVLVFNMNNEPLMPTTPSRAKRWIKTRKATPFWKKGIFCVRLNIKTLENKQLIVLGIDPGSKKEGYTVKSKKYTFLNIQSDTVDWVKESVEVRKNARRTRRYRKTPYRKQRLNRKRGGLTPSIKARWQLKLRIINWLMKLYPITDIIVEDIKTESKEGQKRWNKSFSPLEIGKNWFYCELRKIANLHLKQGYETKTLRDSLGLKKSKNKLDNTFEAHCVDSWVLAYSIVGGNTVPDNKDILYIVPLRFHRRQLHVFVPAKGGKRRVYGGTMSMGLKRGSLVKYKKYGICYVGGISKDQISLHNMSGKRISQSVKVVDCKFLTYNSWRYWEGISNKIL